MVRGRCAVPIVPDSLLPTFHLSSACNDATTANDDDRDDDDEGNGDVHHNDNRDNGDDCNDRDDGDGEQQEGRLGKERQRRRWRWQCVAMVRKAFRPSAGGTWSKIQVVFVTNFTTFLTAKDIVLVPI